MAVGAVPEEEPQLEEPGGLANFDADAAAAKFADIGAGLPSQGPPAPGGADDLMAPTPDAEAPAAPPGAPAPDNGLLPMAGAPDQPKPSETPGTELLKPTTFKDPQEEIDATRKEYEALGPTPTPPKPPVLTNDPQKNVQNNLQYSRDLNNYTTELNKRQVVINRHAAAVQAQQTGREAALEREQQANRLAEQKAFQARQQQRQEQLDAAIGQRTAAMSDLTKDRKFSWRDAVSIALGGLSQGLSNAAAAQLHEVGNAQNPGLNAINAKIAREHQERKEKLQAASDAVMEARYGYKDAAENHRAALNDLDADTAARYRWIAKEAEDQLRQMGADAASIAQNRTVAEANAKATQIEQGIHQREESIQASKENAAATQNIARAHLGLARAQLEETKSQHAKTDEEKKSAAAEKKAAAEDARTYRDPETGEPVGLAPTARGVQTLADKQVAAKAASDAIRAYRDHIQEHGQILNPFSDDYKERERLHADVVARMRKAQDLGVSNAQLALEEKNVGGSGLGLSRQASVKSLTNLADEQDKIAAERIRSVLKPIKKAAPAATVGGGDAAKDARAWDVINDPKQSQAERQGAMRYLVDRGQL